MIGQLNAAATAQTRARYSRIAPVYDLMQTMGEKRQRPWRQHLWSLVEGPSVLEVGVGTGMNLEFYRPELQVTAVDLTPRMLERARKRAQAMGTAVDLRLGDVQALEFPDGTFETAVATCVFCSVPDPVLGLSEMLRVVKPGGQVLLLEHMRSANRVVGALMDLANPLVVRMMGANINRRTVENVRRSGLEILQIEDLGGGGIFKRIIARRPEESKIF